MRTHFIDRFARRVIASPSAIAVALLLAATSPLAAQGRWKEIGRTTSNNPVFIDPSSVRTKEGIVTARLQVKFVEPVKTPKGNWMLSRHVAMFNCAKKIVAAKSTYYYGDAAARKVVDSSVAKIPGFGSPIGGSMTQIAMDYVCKNH
jgi:hypothetical protein